MINSTYMSNMVLKIFILMMKKYMFPLLEKEKIIVMI